MPDQLSLDVQFEGSHDNWLIAWTPDQALGWSIINVVSLLRYYVYAAFVSFVNIEDVVVLFE